MTPPRTLEAIRADFPALARRHAGWPVAYFDGPGGTQVPEVVARRVADVMLHHNANAHWHFPTSRETDAILDHARATFAAFLGGAEDEIAFGANFTSLAFHLARGLGRAWQPGDEVIVTELDHHANVAPWQALAEERGIVLRWWPMDVASGTLSLEHLPALLTPRTRLLAVGGASNALGTITDLAAACASARARGILTFVDAVHLAPHHLVDAAAIGADFIGCSPYKFYGPHLGVLWGRRDLLATVNVPRLQPATDTAPERVQVGTPSFEAIAGAATAVEWLATIGGGDGPLRARLEATYAVLAEREAAQFARLWAGLGTVPGLVRHGPPPGTPRTATVSVTLGDRSAAALAAALAERAGCFASHGDFYAMTVAERLGVRAQGLLRLGLAVYSTAEDVDRVVAALAAEAA
jgi:cysteine desulfurase family protein (TIGR01976 family)